MGATEEIIKMAKKNNGTVTTAMVVAAGISRGNIKYLVDKGMIEKSARVAEVLTPGGNTVRAYSVERTLCDILRPHSHVDIQVVTEAFKRYATRTDKNIPVLSEYAKTLKMEKKLRAYLEVLL